MKYFNLLFSCALAQTEIATDEPLLLEYNQEMFSEDGQSYLLLFLSASSEDFAAKTDIAQEIAKKYKGEMLFVTINMDEEDYKTIMEFAGMEESELPSMRIVRVKGDDIYYRPDLVQIWYRPESTELSDANMRSFIKQYLAGSLKPHLMSQDIPQDLDKDPVLVGKNFKEVALDTNKDVLVRFYAPW